jgi:hypothetical protein
VSVNIVDNHEKEKDQYMKFMDGKGKKKNNQDTGFNNCLKRVEGISGPGGWIGGLVVNQVKKFEQMFLVHHAVHPVKIGVVHEEHDGEDGPKVNPTMAINPLV